MQPFLRRCRTRMPTGLYGLNNGMRKVGDADCKLNVATRGDEIAGCSTELRYLCLVLPTSRFPEPTEPSAFGSNRWIFTRSTSWASNRYWDVHSKQTMSLLCRTHREHSSSVTAYGSVYLA